MQEYLVPRLEATDALLKTEVPASKSLLSRALLLAALAPRTVVLSCGSYGEDTAAMLGCLHALGIAVREGEGFLEVAGCGGDIPNRRASIHVGNAGTAARFLPAALAFCGGEYEFHAAEQMTRRPMQMLRALSEAGVKIEYLGAPEHFPFRLFSNGITKNTIALNTDTSTQYASGMLLAASALSKAPFSVSLKGGRTHGSYIEMTLNVIRAFGADIERKGDEITVFPARRPAPARYRVEADVSAACYFFALALLCSCKVFVAGVTRDSLQGDIRLLSLLEARGVIFVPSKEGLLADGTGVVGFCGFDEDLRDFSDQTLTLAALAPFANSVTRLRNLSHIRSQECDRLNAAVQNLRALGVDAETDGNDLTIFPSAVTGGKVCTFGDHRVAMAFALVGLKAGGVTIDDPACCSKTFPRYFHEIARFTGTLPRSNRRFPL